MTKIPSSLQLTTHNQNYHSLSRVLHHPVMLLGPLSSHDSRSRGANSECCYVFCHFPTFLCVAGSISRVLAVFIAKRHRIESPGTVGILWLIAMYVLFNVDMLRRQRQLRRAKITVFSKVLPRPARQKARFQK